MTHLRHPLPPPAGRSRAAPRAAGWWLAAASVGIAAQPLPGAAPEPPPTSAVASAARSAEPAAASLAGPPRAPAPVNGTGYAARADVIAWAEGVSQRRDLDPAWVIEQLDAARFAPAVTRLIMPPPAGTAKDWRAYRARFIEPVRVRAGLQWWQAHERWLRLAEERWGVPPEVVVSIVGIETLYGRHMGDFRVLDALATLAFDFPSGRRDRSAFFRDELERFLELAHREGGDTARWRGSFAGAIGLPQFMPSSMLRYAVDLDGDGRVDLQRSAADAIGSVARYLAEFGWRRGLPPWFEVAVPVDTADRAALLAPDILPTFTAAQFVERGAWLPAAAHETDSLLALVELQNGDAAPTYVAGTTNFYAITRYNWSSYYAMAVIDLATVLRGHRLASR